MSNLERYIGIKHLEEKEALWELQKAIEYLTFVSEKHLRDIREIKKALNGEKVPYRKTKNMMGE